MAAASTWCIRGTVVGLQLLCVMVLAVHPYSDLSLWQLGKFLWLLIQSGPMAALQLSVQAPFSLLPLGLCYCCLFVLTMTAYVLCCGSNPGYQPKKEEDTVPTKAGWNLSRLNAILSAHLHPPPLKVAGSSTRLYNPMRCSFGGYCTQCQVLKLQRTRHCYDCDRCVRNFDHHCMWLGNCVGCANYSVFIAYLILQTILLIANVVLGGKSLLATLLTARLSIYLIFALLSLSVIMVTLFFCIFVGMLDLFHCRLILTGRTTLEALRGFAIGFEGYPVKWNPYSRSNVIENIWHCFRHRTWEVASVPVRYRQPAAQPDRYQVMIPLPCCEDTL